MNEKKVVRIAPKIRTISNSDELLPKEKKRVCAYARVSTDTTDQLHSFNTQIKEYKKRIKKNEDWEFVDMYADEGISGTSIKKRVGFQRMLDDARNGKIDLILTKSLSRFARNTVDCLSIVRELRSINVEVRFEKENLSSADTKIDFILTIFSSIAQEESRNISENVKWGIRRRFKEGTIQINTSRFLGYDKDEKGNLVINPEEAETVKVMFNLFIAGLSYKEICAHLMENKYKTAIGNYKCYTATVMRTLKNEKYMGDVLLQKHVCVDYLTHKSVRNTGQVPQYYIKNNHEAIIDREVFEVVQRLQMQRPKYHTTSTYTNKFPLSGLVICGECQRVLNRSYFNYRKPSQRIVLTCKNTKKEKVNCHMTPVDNDTLEMACADALRKLEIMRPDLIEDTVQTILMNFQSTELHDQIADINSEINKIEAEIDELIQFRVSNKLSAKEQHLVNTFNKKTKQIKKLNIEKDQLEIKLANNYVKKSHAKKLEEFLDNKCILNRKALSLIVKTIVEIKPDEVIICISDIDIPRDLFVTKLDKIRRYKMLFKSKVTNEKTNITIKYKVIKYGVELL